jgi:hypothetical protein
MYCITIDNPWVSDLIVKTLKPFNKKVGVRIVCDLGVDISEYTEHFKNIKSVTNFLMAEICDSASMKLLDPEQFKERTKTIKDTLGSYIDVYEIGNEVNGDWLGISTEQKIKNAQDVLLDKKMAITFYSCESDNWIHWIVTNWMVSNVDLVRKCQYVFLSEYPQDNNGYRTDFNDFFNFISNIHPNCQIGYGECGTNVKSMKVKEFNYYYKSQHAKFKSNPRYFGGYFWWYQKDFVSINPILLAKLKILVK